MKKYILVILILLFVSLSAQPKVSLAIMDFEPKGSEKSEASIIGDLFRDFLFETRKFVVVDRASMEAILVEQNLQQALGCTSEECAVQVGKILGVNYTIIGTLGKLGNVYIVSVRMVNIENAKIEWTKSERVNSFEQIDFLIRNLVSDLVKTVFHEEVAIQPTPTPTPTPTYTPPPTPTPTPTYTPTPHTQKYYPPVPKKGPDLGVDLSLGFGFNQNFYYDLYDYEQSYENTGHPGRFNLRLGLYWELLYFGLNTTFFTFRAGDILETDGYEWILGSDNTYNFTDLQLAIRISGIHGGALLYFMWRSFSHTVANSNYDPYAFAGPGLGFRIIAGSPYQKDPNSLPIGILFEFDLNAACMFWDKPDNVSDDWSHFGISTGANIGIGAILKRFGAYFMINYSIHSMLSWYEYYNPAYYDYYDMEEIILLHGIYLTIGVNLNLGALGM